MNLILIQNKCKYMNMMLNKKIKDVDIRIIMLYNEYT